MQTVGDEQLLARLLVPPEHRSVDVDESQPVIRARVVAHERVIEVLRAGGGRYEHNFTFAGNPIAWAVADAGRMPVARGRVDRIISNLPWGRQVEARGALAGAPDRFFREVRRVLSARGRAVLLLHEATLTGGIGGELAAIIGEHAFEYLDAPIMRVASLDSPVPYAPNLETAFLPSVTKVVEAAKKLVEY